MEVDAPIDLTVLVRQDGLSVAAAGGVLGPGCVAVGGPSLTIPMQGSSDDLDAFRKCIAQIRAAFPEESSVWVVPEESVTYARAVAVLAALVASGFDPVLSTSVPSSVEAHLPPAAVP